MKHLLAGALMAALLGLTGTAWAEKKSDPTGVWKWTVNFGGQSRDMTLKLKLDGDKLTGSMPGRDGKERSIEDGKFSKGEVSFKMTRERDGKKFTMKYAGKLSGDTIKGKTEFERDGSAQSRDWEAKRSKD